MIGIWTAYSRTFRVSSSLLRDLPILSLYTSMYLEEDLSKAIQAYRAGEYTSVVKLADAYSIPRSTLRRRL